MIMNELYMPSAARRGEQNGLATSSLRAGLRVVHLSLRLAGLLRPEGNRPGL